MRKLLTIAGKDARVLVRDKTAMLILVAMPAVLILILGLALGGIGGGGNPEGLQVVLVNEDAGHIGEDISKELTQDERLGEIFSIETGDDAAAARDAVARGDAAAASVIPADFTAKMEKGEPVGIELLEDPGRPIAASAWAAVVRSVTSGVSALAVVGATSAEAAQTYRGVRDPAAIGNIVNAAVRQAEMDGGMSLVTVEPREIEQGRQVTMMDYYAGSMTAMFLLFGSMFGAFSFIGERRTWTLPRVLTTPTSKASLVGGKMLGLFLVGALQFAVLYLYTRFMLQVWWGSSFPALLALALAEVAAAVGMAVLISAIAKTERAAGAIGPLAIQLFALVGGAFFPIAAFPGWMKAISVISPVTWAMNGIQALQRGAGWAGVSDSVAVLLGIAVLFFGVGVWRLRYE